MGSAFEAGSFPVAMLTGDPVARVASDASVQAAAEALVAGDVGALVVGDGDRPAAVVSERDVVRAVSEGRDLLATPVLEIASTDLIWCDAEATVDEVASMMNERYVRHILVEEGGRLMGMVSARDLVGVYCTDPGLDLG